MNERIEQLAEQSGLKVESWMTNPPKPFQILGSTEQFEKFAELIVRECTAVCMSRSGITITTQAGYIAHLISKNISELKNDTPFKHQ